LRDAAAVRRALRQIGRSSVACQQAAAPRWQRDPLTQQLDAQTGGHGRVGRGGRRCRARALEADGAQPNPELFCQSDALFENV